MPDGTSALPAVYDRPSIANDTSFSLRYCLIEMVVKRNMFAILIRKNKGY
jgi:hypothetical protein